MDQKMQLLREIKEIEFMAVELNLFLDTHPCDQRALTDYNCYVQQLMALKDKYQKSYGPLMNFGNATSSNPWQWIEGPWPWQRI